MDVILLRYLLVKKHQKFEKKILVSYNYSNIFRSI